MAEYALPDETKTELLGLHHFQNDTWQHHAVGIKHYYQLIERRMELNTVQYRKKAC